MVTVRDEKLTLLMQSITAVFFFPYIGHFGWDVVITYCVFNLHFSDSKWS